MLSKLGLLFIIFLTFVLVMAIDLCYNFVPAQYLDHMDRTSPNFIHVYAFILTRSRLRVLPVIFCLYVTELNPLMHVSISFPLKIFRTNE